MKTLLSALFVLSLVGLLSASHNNCTFQDPVCASKNGKFKTFPNSCEADASNFSVQHEGPCFAKYQKLNACSAKCLVPTKSPVCGEVGGRFKNFVNECFANCENATIVSNSSCTKSREMSFAWLDKLINAVKNAFNRTERWVENKTATAVNKTKQVWHQIGNQWELCNCEAFDDVVNWVKKITNETEDLANRTATELEIIEHNTIEGFYLFKNKVKEDLQKLENKTIDIAKKLVNRTKEFFDKVKNFVHNVTEELDEWIIEEGQSLKNKTATWWHKTKEGLENCTCCLVQETDDLLDKIHEAAEKAENKTKAKLQELEDKLKQALIRFADQGEAALQKTRAFFESLWPCVCPRTYDPICVKTDEGQQATILNQCFADCPKNKLKVVFNGTCEDMAAQKK